VTRRITPGPWIALENSNRIVTRDGVTVALSCTGNEPDRQLIAAAPAMLRLLRQAIIAEGPTWDGPHKEDSRYSEPKWLTDSRNLIKGVRART
jgi:hypothetical protein